MTATNADLIAAGRRFDGMDASLHPTDTVKFVRKLTDALEAAEQRADLADADLEVERQKNAGYRSRNDALAAVVEKVRGYVSDLHSGTCHDVLAILASAPDDALREVKAAVWDEASEATGEHIENGGEFALRNPYRAREERS